MDYVKHVKQFFLKLFVLLFKRDFTRNATNVRPRKRGHAKRAGFRKRGHAKRVGFRKRRHPKRPGFQMTT